MNQKTLTISIAGKEIHFETGTIARQSNGSILIRSGETMLLATACAKFEDTDTDFLPLRVDYIERFSSAGKTLGGFIKREGKPTEKETLVCRLIDRPLRPLFADGYYNETQVITQVLSYDGIHATEPLAICAASAALVISDIPLKKPVGAVRVGRIEGKWVINPTTEQMKESDLDLMLAGTKDAILMIEGFCDFLTEEELLEAVEEGHTYIQTICEHLSDWQANIGKEKNMTTLRPHPEALIASIDEIIKPRIDQIIRIPEKETREEATKELLDEILNQFLPEDGSELEHTLSDIQYAFKKRHAHYMRQMILKENQRSDGRTQDEIRPISINPGLLPRTHGSALFTRGETQSLAVCTLGSDNMGQRYEDLDEDGVRRFYLQYSFPPYSVGEVGRMGPPGRREIGHGKLAERALAPTMPSKTHFPYTIRLESNITESNGSSSMATVCGCCLAMMAGGVPIERPIAGIAMGLILEGKQFAILSDILGVEDALGDMDFKVAGDAKGITAFQLDIKVEGITHEIMQAALMQAKQGRMHILQKMLETLPQSKTTLSKHAPKIITLEVKPSKIATIIGPGGKQIRAIIEQTGVDIDIDDDGIVSITSTDQEAIDEAKRIIINLTAEVEVGKTYDGKIVSIKDFGLFVKVYSQEGLCHISELSNSRINEDLKHLFKEGDKLPVKVMDINTRGQISFSHKATFSS